MYRILIIATTLFGLIACNTEELKRLQDENQNLRDELETKDDALSGFVETINVIYGNLDTIAMKENLISNIAISGEKNRSVGEYINDQINLMYSMLIDNRNKLDELNKNFQKLNVQNKNMQEMIDRLTQQLETKDIEIQRLLELLEEKDFQIQGLNIKVESMRIVTESQKQRIEDADTQIEQQQEQLNTAYYVIGTEKELIKNGVLSKQKRIMPDLNKDYFEKIDIQEKKSFIIGYKKVQIASSHPNDSYSIIGTNRIVDSLVVDNPESFWSNSKYLIIIVNK